MLLNDCIFLVLFGIYDYYLHTINIILLTYKYYMLF